MKLLYISCHEVLEQNEVSLFLELGLDVFSYGAYVNLNEDRTNLLRPSIPNLKYSPEDIEAYDSIAKRGLNRDTLPQDFIDRFDIIYVMHMPEWIVENWEKLKYKIVIWRTIGQSLSHQEQMLKVCPGLKIVRYSPAERRIPDYLGETALIRFYKNENEFCSWNGEKKEVITVAQSMVKRDTSCNYSLFEAVTRPFPRKLFGPFNEECPFWAGKLGFEELKQAYRDYRVYQYTGTHPASYTLNFIEAWLTGIPIVAIGSENGNAHYYPGHKLYEVDTLIENGVTGFCSDSVSALQAYIKELLTNDALATFVSANGRAKAKELFSKTLIIEQWCTFFKEIS